MAWAVSETNAGVLSVRVPFQGLCGRTNPFDRAFPSRFSMMVRRGFREIPPGPSPAPDQFFNASSFLFNGAEGLESRLCALGSILRHTRCSTMIETGPAPSRAAHKTRSRYRRIRECVGRWGFARTRGIGLQRRIKATARAVTEQCRSFLSLHLSSGSVPSPRHLQVLVVAWLPEWYV